MRPSTAQKGITGLFPLIKAHAPHAKRQLERWEGVRGWRLAFDGTLLLAKLHFVNSQNPHRHLIGLHTLLQSLRTAGVGSIFVFDNPASTARLPQKAREHAKRRDARAKTAARGRKEQSRLARIEELRRGMQAWEALDEAEKKDAAKLLESWQRDTGVSDATPELEDVQPLLGVVEEEEVAVPTWLEKELRLELQQVSSAEVDSPFIFDTTIDQAPSATSTSSFLTPRVRSSVRPTSAEPQQSAADLLPPSTSADPSPWEAILEAQTSPAYAVAHRIATLRSTYAAEQEAGGETSRQALLSAREGEVYAALQSVDTSSALGKKLSELVVSETQKTLEEETTSESIKERVETEEIAPTLPTDVLASISHSTAHLAASYARHSDHLSSSIIRSAAELCTLHGIPVLWTGSGEPGKRAHEAEAVAARVVLDGYADAVVSEDSDTLLYDVPLIRGALGKEAAFEIVDPKAVREAFFPMLGGLKVREDEEERELELNAQRDFSQLLARVEMAGPSTEEAEEQGEQDSESTALESTSAEAPTSDASATAATGAATRKRTPVATVPKDEESWRRMLELSLLCGTDFNRTVPGVGSVRALRYIRQYGRIRDLLEQELMPPAKAVKESKSTTTAAATKKKRVPKSTSLPITALDVTPSADLKPKPIPRYAPPDNLSWRAYQKELNLARAVFLNMPSLHREAARLKAWNASFAAAAAGGVGVREEDVDKRALAAFWRARFASGKKDSEEEGEEEGDWEVRRVLELAEFEAEAQDAAEAEEAEEAKQGIRKRRRKSNATLGFGANPFGDKPVGEGADESVGSLGESAVWRG